MNFSDEVTAAFRLCDGIVIFVDAAEGVLTVLRVLVLVCSADRMCNEYLVFIANAEYDFHIS